MDDLLAFAPVPTASTHRDGWTPERQRAFVAALAELGAVGAAARSVRMTPQSANRLRRRPGAEEFAAAWDAALWQGRDRAFDEAVRRGRDGHLVPVTRAGRVVAHRRRFDNRLLYAACYGEPATRLRRPDPRLVAIAADPALAYQRALAMLQDDAFPELSEPSTASEGRRA